VAAFTHHGMVNVNVEPTTTPSSVFYHLLWPRERGPRRQPQGGFRPRSRGNPSGKPKSFSIHQLMADAIDDKSSRTVAVRRVQESLRIVLLVLFVAAKYLRHDLLSSQPLADQATASAAISSLH
jgi:hypothetical protein